MVTVKFPADQNQSELNFQRYFDSYNEHRNEGRDPHHQPAAGRLHQHWCQPRPRPPSDRRGGRAERRQEQRPRVLRGERFSTSRLRNRDQATSR